MAINGVVRWRRGLLGTDWQGRFGNGRNDMDLRLINQAKIDIENLLMSYPDLLEDEVIRADMVQGSTTAFELLESLVRAERDAAAMENAVAEEMDRLARRRQRFEARRQALRRGIRQVMETANLKRAELASATVSIAAGRPKVVITDESQLADYFMRVKKEPDKEKIRLAIVEDGIVVPGATLSNSEQVLRIS
jgi:hypothetical protein